MTAVTAVWKDVRSAARPYQTAWLASLAVVFLIALLDWSGLPERLRFAADALLHTAPYVLIAVAAIAYLKATEAESVIANAFVGNESKMIVIAAMIGGLAPFCSCEVIPFVAALLAAGTPISAVMAFWLSSPLMDPPAFMITTGALGLEFAVGKTLSAVGIGLTGGFIVKVLLYHGYFSSPLKPVSSCSSCCSATHKTQVNWQFWREKRRITVFRSTALENALFLLKWLTLAYLLEAVMIAYIPAETIAGVVGGDGFFAIVVGAFVGIPAYLNAYAAPALVDGLIQQGMSAGAGMAFMTAGGMTCIPAMAAVFALVKRTVFISYLVLALSGAILSGLLFGAYARIF